MRISDWSSDLCSSDLIVTQVGPGAGGIRTQPQCPPVAVETGQGQPFRFRYQRQGGARGVVVAAQPEAVEAFAQAPKWQRRPGLQYAPAVRTDVRDRAHLLRPPRPVCQWECRLGGKA